MALYNADPVIGDPEPTEWSCEECGAPINRISVDGLTPVGVAHYGYAWQCSIDTEHRGSNVPMSVRHPGLESPLQP